MGEPVVVRVVGHASEQRPGGAGDIGLTHQALSHEEAMRTPDLRQTAQVGMVAHARFRRSTSRPAGTERCELLRGGDVRSARVLRLRLLMPIRSGFQQQRPRQLGRIVHLGQHVHARRRSPSAFQRCRLVIGRGRRGSTGCSRRPWPGFRSPASVSRIKSLRRTGQVRRRRGRPAGRRRSPWKWGVSVSTERQVAPPAR